MKCPKCGNRMKIVAFLTQYSNVDRIIDHLNLPPPESVFPDLSMVAKEISIPFYVIQCASLTSPLPHLTLGGEGKLGFQDEIGPIAATGRKKLFADLFRIPENIQKKHHKAWAALHAIVIPSFLFHFAWIFIFFVLRIFPLSILNIFSSLVWLILIIFWKRFNIFLSAISYLEIFIHQLLCLYYLGWNSGFIYLFFFTLLYPLLAPKEWKFFKFITGLLFLLGFIAALIFLKNRLPVALVPSHVLDLLYSVNMILFLILISLNILYFSMTSDKYELLLIRERDKSDHLLLNILPNKIANQLKEKEDVIADDFEQVSVLFADIVDFTPFSETKTPKELVRFLNNLFSIFDEITDHYKLEKIKTIGDAYMITAGIPEPQKNHAFLIANCALEMMASLKKIEEPIQLRIGIHSGSVVAGVIGKKKFSYDLWGDTVNTAARMESHGTPGEIHVTEKTYQLIKDSFVFEKRGIIQIKGKGEIVTYFLKGRI